MRFVKAWAPSNLALIKYMGKVDSELNLPANGSLSVTLNKLRTTTELRELPGQRSAQSRIVWNGLAPEMERGKAPILDEKALTKVERHFERVRLAAPALLSSWGIPLREPASAIELRTANTFPASSGIASSASSFAALTLASVALFADDERELARVHRERPEFSNRLAELSRQASGSSCRSFHGPFVAWEGSEVRPLAGPASLSHFVIVVSTEAKAVPSSEAHLRVKTSPLWSGRPERARLRLAAIEPAVAQGDFGRIARLAWEETWEMHSLFHTSAEPFSYWEPQTLFALRFLEPFVHAGQAIVTLDAGPNVHVLVPSADAAGWRNRLQEAFSGREIIEDAPGRGASLEQGQV